MGWWLRTPDGVRLPIGGGGILIGRAPDSDVVLTDDRASRRQALVFMAGEQPCIASLGQGPMQVDGEPVSGDHLLSAGQTLAVPSLKMTVQRTEASPEDPDDEWVLQRIGGGLYGVSVSPFSVGGTQDNLHFEGWPNRALVFWRTAGRISVEVGAVLSVDGEVVRAGQVVGCRSGTQIELEGVRLQVLVGAGSLASTAADDGADIDARPQAVRLSFLPRGARLYITDGSAERAVYLPERRAELVALLLSPPEPCTAGDFVADEVLLQRLWPRQTKTPNDLHVLVHRVRKSLSAAGIDGPALVERDPQAGATRFGLAPRASVTID